MSNITTKQGFVSQYQIFAISSIRITPAGDFEGKSYSASLTFKSSVLSQIDDEKFGLIDKEVSFNFKIPSDDSDLKKLNIFLRTFDFTKKYLVLSCGIPVLQSKDNFNITSLFNSTDVIKMNSEVIK